MSARVLIVDDEKRLAFSLGQTLQIDFPDCRVDTANSGEEALSALASKTYDLIIADVRMPGVSGLELIKGVRYLDAEVPIILMTGYGSELLRRQAATLGVDHYIDKPFDIDELISLVGALLPGEGDPDA
jgi:two-component system response regulator (stage 0 sporulation protein F)